MSSDLALFRRRLMRNPRQVSAIAPSSRALARAMTLGLGPQSGPVVEFGPGTGRSYRRDPCRAVCRPKTCHLVRAGRGIRRSPAPQFPGVTVHQRRAARPRADAWSKRRRRCRHLGPAAFVDARPMCAKRSLRAAFDILAPASADMCSSPMARARRCRAETVEALGLTVEQGPQDLGQPAARPGLPVPPRDLSRFGIPSHTD